MSPIDEKTDQLVRTLFLGNLNKLRTLLAYTSGTIKLKSTTDLNKLIEDLHGVENDNQACDKFSAKNQKLCGIYKDFLDQNELTTFPLERRHAEKVRQSLIRQEYKISPPQPWFDRQFLDAILNDTDIRDVDARASFIFEMLFANLEPQSSSGTACSDQSGIPHFESIEEIRHKIILKRLDYGDVVNAWQVGQVEKNICETGITGKSSNTAVNRLLNMKDAQLSATLARAIDDGLEDLQRRNIDMKNKHMDIDKTFQRIEQLWSKRPAVKFVQEQPPLYKRLDRYLFQSNIERFLDELTGPIPSPRPLALPRNPINLIRTRRPKGRVDPFWTPVGQRQHQQRAQQQQQQPQPQPRHDDYGEPETSLLTWSTNPTPGTIADNSEDSSSANHNAFTKEMSPRPNYKEGINKDSSTDPMDFDNNDNDSYASKNTMLPRSDFKKGIHIARSTSIPETKTRPTNTTSGDTNAAVSNNPSAGRVKPKQLRIRFQDKNDETALKTILTRNFSNFIGNNNPYWNQSQVDLKFDSVQIAQEFEKNIYRAK